ncbi:hypothetical protein ACQEU3_26425 [Spirillospora sp. CA-253888]
MSGSVPAGIVEGTRTPTKEGHPMKALLWIVLTIAITINAATSFAFDGATQILVSVVTGVLVIASGVGLFLMREDHS